MTGTKKVPHIPRKDVKLLFHIGYWDGPLSGLCEYRGATHWFQRSREHRGYRYFFVIPISVNEIVKHMEIHKEFQKYVGTHTDYRDGWMDRDFGGVAPSSEHHHFYDRKYKYTNKYPVKDAVGEFRWP